MKLIMVLSDTHRNFFAIDYLLPRMKECDYVIHLGDNEKDMAGYKKELGNKLVTVKGNCDSLFNPEKIIKIEKINFLITHGNKYNVKNTLAGIHQAATEQDCRIVLYGHTHIAAITTFDDITLICPGALAANAVKKTYAYIVVSNSEALPKIVEVAV